MISKEKFVKIIDRLKETNDMVNKVNDIIINSTDSIISDFTNVGSFMICHEDIVVDLLENMFNDSSIISWWLYELEYGKKYKRGCLKEADGTIVSIPTSSELYDYLVKNMD